MGVGGASINDNNLYDSYVGWFDTIIQRLHLFYDESKYDSQVNLGNVVYINQYYKINNISKYPYGVTDIALSGKKATINFNQSIMDVEAGKFGTIFDARLGFSYLNDTGTNQSNNSFFGKQSYYYKYLEQERNQYSTSLDQWSDNIVSLGGYFIPNYIYSSQQFPEL